MSYEKEKKSERTEKIVGKFSLISLSRWNFGPSANFHVFPYFSFRFSVCDEKSEIFGQWRNRSNNFKKIKHYWQFIRLFYLHCDWIGRNFCLGLKTRKYLKFHNSFSLRVTFTRKFILELENNAAGCVSWISFHQYSNTFFVFVASNTKDVDTQVKCFSLSFSTFMRVFLFFPKSFHVVEWKIDNCYSSFRAKNNFHRKMLYDVRDVEFFSGEIFACDHFPYNVAAADY